MISPRAVNNGTGLIYFFGALGEASAPSTCESLQGAYIDLWNVINKTPSAASIPPLPPGMHYTGVKATEQGLIFHIAGSPSRAFGRVISKLSAKDNKEQSAISLSRRRRLAANRHIRL